MTDLATEPSAPRKSLTPTEVARQPICTECGNPLPPRAPKAKGQPRQYCSDPCKRRRSARRLARGSAIIEWAQTWRRNRGSGPIAQGALAQLCQILDQFNAEDLAAGRPSADLAAARMLVDGTMFFDRQRLGPGGRKRKSIQREPQPDPMADILRQIAEGHNDPRRLAEEALGLRDANAASN